MMACQLGRASTDSTGLGHDHVIIQDHAAGRVFGEGGNEGQGPHFNVRPPNGTRSCVVPGALERYGLGAGLMSANSINFSVIDGGDLLCDLYQPEGPRPSAVLADIAILDLAAGTVGLRVYVRQIPTSLPEWWAADADMLAIALECRGAVEVDVRFDCPESEGLVVRGIPDGRVKVTLVRRDHRMRVVARECVLVEFKAMRWGGGCA